MNGKNINFDDKKIKKVTFTKKNKKIFNIDDIGVNKILVSKKERYGKYKSRKYFIRYDDNVITRLCLKFSKLTGYINEFNENKNTITITLRLMMNNFLKNRIKYGKKLRS